jgi:hypothetical protein
MGLPKLIAARKVPPGASWAITSSGAFFCMVEQAARPIKRVSETAPTWRARAARECAVKRIGASRMSNVKMSFAYSSQFGARINQAPSTATDPTDI